MNTKQNLDTYLHFLGHGNPDNKIWFVGIEEGGDIGDKDSFKDVLKERKQNQYLFMESTNQKTQVWDIIYKLVIEINQNIDRSNMFDKQTSSFFLSNLFCQVKEHLQ